MERRHFLSVAGLAAIGGVAVRSASVDDPDERGIRLIDTNVSLGAWPIRHSWAQTTSDLVAKLHSHGVVSAWTSSLDGVFQSDLAGVNDRLAETCRTLGRGILQPFGVANPTLPAWETDLSECAEKYRMAGVRLYPNYHGYALDDRRFIRLLERASTLGLVVQISLSIEDDRSQNPALVAAPVQAAPLVDALQVVPGARVMLLNGFSRVLGGNPVLVRRLTAAGVFFEIATLEGVAGVEAWLRSVPGVRLAFGSHTPYFYFESALLKLQESALTREQLDSVSHLFASEFLAQRPVRPL